MVKESKARAVEDLLLNMARSGQLREKVGEKQLIELLETISSQSVAEPKIKVFIFS
jgi:programmed cell death protein 5